VTTSLFRRRSVEPNPDTHTNSDIYADTDSKRNTDRESNRNAYSYGYANHNAYSDAHTHGDPTASPHPAGDSSASPNSAAVERRPRTTPNQSDIARNFRQCGALLSQQDNTTYTYHCIDSCLPRGSAAKAGVFVLIVLLYSVRN
jgi:hypothetical protein